MALKHLLNLRKRLSSRLSSSLRSKLASRLNGPAADQRGVALFMVIAAVAILVVLVTEFVYIAQINQMIAYGGLDQAKAHYLAKSGLKISLLRLKAYQQVRNLVQNMGGDAGAAMVPKSLIEKIWSFPFIFPIPTNIPGMSASDKDNINKFMKDSNLEGSYTAVIESESSKYNLNLLLPSYASAAPVPSSSPTSSGSNRNQGQNPTPNTSPTPSSTPAFDPEVARQSLGTFLGAILLHKVESDPDFASMYRDLRMEDLVDNISAWEDRSYDRRTSANRDPVPMKRAPFYGVSELHFLANLDDTLYNLFAPNLTASPTVGIDINTMQEPTLRALIPILSKDEVTEFFKFRDSEEIDNSFKKPDDFYGYLSKAVAAFKGNQQAIDNLKSDLAKRNIHLITEETQFKITVQAKVNSATRTIEAWVTLGTPQAPTPPSGQPPSQSQPPGTPSPPPGQGATPGRPTGPDSGLKITFMKVY